MNQKLNIILNEQKIKYNLNEEKLNNLNEQRHPTICMEIAKERRKKIKK